MKEFSLIWGDWVSIEDTLFSGQKVKTYFHRNRTKFISVGERGQLFWLVEPEVRNLRHQFIIYQKINTFYLLVNFHQKELIPSLKEDFRVMVRDIKPEMIDRLLIVGVNLQLRKATHKELKKQVLILLMEQREEHQSKGLKIKEFNFKDHWELAD